MTIRIANGWKLRLASAAVGPLVAIIVAVSASAFDLQGHRGARGLAPENTLDAFRKALEIGVTTLETDLAITKDDVIVLSHDPALNPDITRQPDGAWLSVPGPAINTLTLAELMRYDVGRIKPGSRYGRQFPEQRPVDEARIPTLIQLFELTKALRKSPRFNLETKLSPEKPAETPDPEAFARLVVEAVRDAQLSHRTTVQSFDWRTLIAVRKHAPEIETVCLTSRSTLQDRFVEGRRQASLWLAGIDPAEHGGSAPRLAKAAGCATWSPRYTDITPELVKEAHALGLKVVPWTINAPADMARIVAIGVDGLITDYPDRALPVLSARGIGLP